MTLPTMSEQQAADTLRGMPSVEAVRRLETELRECPQVVIEPKHLIHGGMYARTVLIPAGTLLTGALTCMDNVCVVCGDITVTTDEGPQRLQGFHVLPARAGAKRVGVAHADTWWTTLIATEERDVRVIEAQATSEPQALQTNQEELWLLS